MSFTPRTLNGRICCSNPTALCEPCKAYHAAFAAARSASEEDAPPLSANATFKEKYAAERTREFAQLRAATRVLETHNATHPLEMRNLEALDDVPNPYASVTENRAPIQSDIEPDFDPSYRPYGAPPDSYKLAMALRTLNAQEAK